jgi:uncharacterized membrane protein
MAFCSVCGTQVADGTTLCPAHAVGGAGAATLSAQAGGLTDNVAGMLAYFTIIPAIIFLLVAPFNRNKFIRFHSFQCIFLCIAMIVLSLGLGVVMAIPGLFWMTLMLRSLIGLAAFVLWIVLVIKAYQGQMWKLPVIGDLAEKQAAAM